MAYNTQQIMMTLAALAGTATNQRLFESLEHQEERALKWINEILAEPGLATGGAWKATWVGLSADRANMAYIAQNAAANQFALSIRGTNFSIKIDVAEDNDVSETVSFAEQAGAPSQISQGAMEAFQEVTGAVSTLSKTTLAQELQKLADSHPGAQFFITGHSLGGCVATTVALYLNNLAQRWSNKVSFQVYTFAAPTAGTQEFAQLFAKTFAKSSWRVYNLLDVVPNAWQTLSKVADFYPGGPQATSIIKDQLTKAQASTNGNAYMQPITNEVPLNQQGLRDMNHTANLTYDFIQQVGFQHDVNTYLKLLEAPTVAVKA
jgi:pimeloyl-ACP methyl ester carboxylesterase